MKNIGRTLSATGALVITGIYAATPNPIWPLVITIAALAMYNLYTAQIRDRK